MIGFTEVLTFILCSKKEDFAMLNRKDDKSKAVIIGNPRSSDFEVYTFIFLFYGNAKVYITIYLIAMKK